MNVGYVNHPAFQRWMQGSDRELETLGTLDREGVPTPQQNHLLGDRELSG